MEIIHTDFCYNSAVKNRCNDCKRKYYRDLYYKNKTPKKQSIYSNILCIDCKDKTTKDFCHECGLKYDCAKNAKSVKKRRLPVESDPTQSNRPNPTDLIRLDYGSSIDNVNDSNGSGVADDCVVKKKSIYADLLCITCQYKTRKEYCSECEAKYNLAKKRKSCSAKKQKKSIETINPNNQSNVTDQIQLV